jgi:hypothetical protein
MPDSLPNLAGVATQNLVEKIGSGSFSAVYINWSRSLNLLREHAPGWCVETVSAGDGGLVHRAPGNGGYLLLRFRHIDGTVTPEVPQAIMDNRNAAIPYERITARDVTDTHRRGACLAAAMTFGLAYELWAKQPLESGYADTAEPVGVPTQQGEPPVKTAKPAAKTRTTTAPAKKPEATKESFLEAAVAKGLTTHAADALLEKLNGNYSGGIDRLNEKDEEWVKSFNEACAPKNSADKW